MRFQELYDVDLSDSGTIVGTGAFSTVHKCVHRATGGEYAVKVINVEKMRASEKAKIEREAQICQMLKHDNIVKMSEFFKEESRYFLVFEYVSGGELFEEIVTRTYYNEEDASECVFQILSALKVCHDARIIHRDLKPENLLLANKEPGAPVKLTDFGLAVIMSKGPTYFGFAGTPGYLSPEVCRRVPYGPAVDMWAVGVILYILLAGYPPFWHDDHQVLYEQIKAGDYDYPSPEWDTVTSLAKELIDRMLDLNPETRISVDHALQHPWIAKRQEVAGKMHRQGTIDELRRFNAKRKLKGGIRAIMTTKRLQTLASFGMSVNKGGGPNRSTEESPPPAAAAAGMFASAVKTQQTLVGDDGPAAKKAPSADERALMAATRALVQSVVDGNWAKYAELCSPELTCFEPEARGSLVQGLAFHKFYFDNVRNDASKVNTTILNLKAQAIGGVAGVVTYIRLTQFIGSAGPVTSRSEETRVWEKKGGRWINVHFHRTGAPSAPLKAQ